MDSSETATPPPPPLARMHVTWETRTRAPYSLPGPEGGATRSIYELQYSMVIDRSTCGVLRTAAWATGDRGAVCRERQIERV